MKKESTLIRIRHDDLAKLKAFAIQYQKPIVDIISGVIDFTEFSEFITDESIANTLRAGLQTCLANAGNDRGEIIPGDLKDSFAVEYVTNRRIKDLEEKKKALESELSDLKLK